MILLEKRYPKRMKNGGANKSCLELYIESNPLGDEFFNDLMDLITKHSNKYEKYLKGL